MKRIAAAALLVLMIFAFGCENVTYPEESGAESGDSRAAQDDLESRLPSYAPESSDGSPVYETFRIFATDTTPFYQEETTPGVISALIEQRNSYIKERYSVEVEVTKYPAAELVNEVRMAAQSDTPICDLVSLPADKAVLLYVNDALGDMNTLPGFDINESWFDKRNGTALATNSTLYILPDPSCLYYDDIYTMFYNRDLLAASGAQNPETLAAEGKWTWDAFDECVALAAAGVISRGSGDVEKDVFGFTAYYTDKNYPLVMWESCGEKMVDNTYKNPVRLGLEMSRITELARFLNNSYNSRAKSTQSGNEAAASFEAGRLAFFCNKLEYLYALRDGTGKGAKFGIVPMPKHNEEQSDYYCLVDSAALVMCIPKSMDNAGEQQRRRACAVISSVCGFAGDALRDAYVSDMIAKYLMNNAEAVSLDMICESASFDFAFVYGTGITAVLEATVAPIYDYLDFGSWIENSINWRLDAFNKYCEANFN